MMQYLWLLRFSTNICGYLENKNQRINQVQSTTIRGFTGKMCEKKEAVLVSVFLLYYSIWVHVITITDHDGYKIFIFYIANFDNKIFHFDLANFPFPIWPNG